jgi:hypothetical protein
MAINLEEPDAPGTLEEDHSYVLCEDLFKITSKKAIVALRGLDLKVRRGE